MTELKFNIKAPDFSPTIWAKLFVEEQNGKCTFEEHTCKKDEDPVNSYLRMRFIQEHKGLRFLPKDVSVHDTRVIRYE
jgi:hypothetical protein